MYIVIKVIREDVIDRLEKEQKRDIAPRSAKKDQRTQIRGEKITALEKLAAALEGDRGNSVHTVKDLCHFRAKQGDDTLLTVLKRHQDPAKRDTKDTKSYQEFYKKFRLDLHGYDPLKPKGAATIKNPLAAMKEARAAKKTIAGMREEKRQSQEPYIDIDTRKNKMNTQSPL